jgi:hypothetical protein
MLGDEHGMSAHRRLPAVVAGMCRRETLAHDAPRVRADGFETLAGEGGPLRRSQAEPAPERRSLERGENVCYGSHING